MCRGDVGEDRLPAGGQVAPVTVQEEVQHETGQQGGGQDGDGGPDRIILNFCVVFEVSTC